MVISVRSITLVKPICTNLTAHYSIILFAMLLIQAHNSLTGSELHDDSIHVLYSLKLTLNACISYAVTPIYRTWHKLSIEVTSDQACLCNEYKSATTCKVLKLNYWIP